MKKEVEISFGAPSHNWGIKFDLTSIHDTCEYEAVFPEKKGLGGKLD